MTNKQITWSELKAHMHDVRWKNKKSRKQLMSRLGALDFQEGRRIYVLDRSSLQSRQDAFSRTDSPATVNAKLNALHLALKEAHQMNWIDIVPTIEPLPVPETKRQVLSEDEQAQLMDAAEGPLYYILVVYLKTGCRACELIDAINTYNKGDERLALLQAKNGKVRYVPVKEDLRNALTCLQVQLYYRATYKHILSMWNKLKVKLGWQDRPNFGLHILRHTVISKLAASGIPVADIQAFVGHANINTTMRYVHANRDHKEIMDVL